MYFLKIIFIDISLDADKYFIMYVYHWLYERVGALIS